MCAIKPKLLNDGMYSFLYSQQNVYISNEKYNFQEYILLFPINC